MYIHVYTYIYMYVNVRTSMGARQVDRAADFLTNSISMYIYLNPFTCIRTVYSHALTYADAGRLLICHPS